MKRNHNNGFLGKLIRAVGWSSFLIFMLLLFSLAGFFVAFYAKMLSADPGLVRWQILTPPPEKPIRIASFHPDSVDVQSETGKIYRCQVETVYGCWVETTFMPPLDMGNCMMTTPVPAPVKKVIDKAETGACGPGSPRRTYYTLDEDGTLWMWRYAPDSSMFSIWESGLRGSVAGFVIGIVILAYLSTTENRENAPLTNNPYSEVPHEES